MNLKSSLNNFVKKMELKFRDNRICVICVFSDETYFAWSKVNSFGNIIEAIQFQRFEGSRQVALKELKSWLSIHKFKGVNCAIVLPPGNYRMLLMDELNVAEDEKYEAMQWVCKDLITESVDLMSLDMFPITVKSAQDPKVYIVMSSKAELVALRDEIHDIGLIVTHIDIADFAIANWITMSKNNHVAILYGNYELIIIENGEIRLARKLGSWGEPLPEANIPELIIEIEASLRFYIEQFSETYPEKILVSSKIFPEHMLNSERVSSLPLKVEIVDNHLLNGEEKLTQDPKNLGAMICEGYMYRWIEQMKYESGEVDETNN